MSKSKIYETAALEIFVALDRCHVLKAFRNQKDAVKFASEYGEDLEYQIEVQKIVLT